MTEGRNSYQYSFDFVVVINKRVLVLGQSLVTIMEEEKQEIVSVAENLTQEQEVQQRREAKKERQKAVMQTMEWLYERFPHCFKREQYLPLKIGMAKDIESLTGEDETAPRLVLIKKALGSYTNSKKYLEALLQQSHRFDLEGHCVEDISLEHKDYAQKMLEQKAALAEKKKKTFKKKKQTQKQMKDPDQATATDQTPEER